MAFLTDFEGAFIVAMVVFILARVTHFIPTDVPVALSRGIVLRDAAVVGLIFALVGAVERRVPRSHVIFRLGLMYCLTLLIVTFFASWAYNFAFYANQPSYQIADYWNWLRNLLTHGNFGSSTQSLGTYSVNSLLAQRAPVTLEIALLATFASTVVAVPGALISALHPNGRIDRAVTAISSLAASLPVFVSAVFIVELLAVHLRWVPSQGWIAIQQSLSGNLRDAVLPVTTLSLTIFPPLLRVLRADLGSIMNSDFVLAAQSRGQPDWYVLTRHALRPALATFVTVAGLLFGQVLSGVVLVEFWFTIPGLGLSLWDSIASTPPDPLVVRGVVTFLVIVYVTLNVIVDVIYRLLDPRIRWS